MLSLIDGKLLANREALHQGRKAYYGIDDETWQRLIARCDERAVTFLTELEESFRKLRAASKDEGTLRWVKPTVKAGLRQELLLGLAEGRDHRYLRKTVSRARLHGC